MNIAITGCTRGLGRALVEPFAALGHTVFGCGRSAPEIAALKKALPKPHGFAALDVTDAAAVQSWAEKILAESGPPQLLINNAAVMTAPAVLWEVPAAEFDRLIDVNIKGVANVLRAFLPAMVAVQRGTIVNLSSGWGRSTSPQVAAYCASKYAIEGLTKSLAQELPRGMCAVTLNPGVIDTDMLRQAWNESAGGYQKPSAWAAKAVPLILGLGPKDNGQSVSVS